MGIGMTADAPQTFPDRGQGLLKRVLGLIGITKDPPYRTHHPILNRSDETFVVVVIGNQQSLFLLQAVRSSEMEFLFLYTIRRPGQRICVHASKARTFTADDGGGGYSSRTPSGSPSGSDAGREQVLLSSMCVPASDASRNACMTSST